MIFRPPSLLATQVVPTAGIENLCQGGRGVYIRANRGSLPPRASDILAVRIGQLTAEVFHLLDLRTCWPLPDFHLLSFASVTGALGCGSKRARPTLPVPVTGVSPTSRRRSEAVVRQCTPHRADRGLRPAQPGLTQNGFGRF